VFAIGCGLYPGSKTPSGTLCPASHTPHPEGSKRSEIWLYILHSHFELHLK